jgi:serine/threonine protein kinase
MSTHDESATDYYTSAVDIWSSGCLAYTILTNKPPFPSSKHLKWYVYGQKGFPTALLVEKNISEPAQKLLKRMLAPAPHNRPTAKECLEDAWTTPRAGEGDRHWAPIRNIIQMLDWRGESTTLDNGNRPIPPILTVEPPAFLPPAQGNASQQGQPDLLTPPTTSDGSERPSPHRRPRPLGLVEAKGYARRLANRQIREWVTEWQK